jgi:arginine/ornithine transport system substrate-binding protein
MKVFLVFYLLSITTSVIAQSADIKVAIDPTYPPFTYKTVDGKLTGFDIDIANALCGHIKRKCVFVEQDWDGMIPGLQDNKYDAIISSMGITEERLKVVDFTDKYYQTSSRIIIKNNVKFAGVASLKGTKIGVLKASSQEKYANGVLKPLGVSIIPYDAQAQVYLDMKSGRLDGTVANIMEATNGFLNKPEGKDFAPVGFELYTFKYFGSGAGIAIRKKDEALKNEFNAAIKAIRANGTYKALNNRYFKIDIYGPQPINFNSN